MLNFARHMFQFFYKYMKIMNISYQEQVDIFDKLCLHSMLKYRKQRKVKCRRKTLYIIENNVHFCFNRYLDL